MAHVPSTLPRGSGERESAIFQVAGAIVGSSRPGPVGGGDLIDGPAQVAADGRWGVEHHDAVPGGQERGLVDAVDYPVQVPLHASDVVALVVQGRAERRPWDRRVVGQVRGAADAGVW